MSLRVQSPHARKLLFSHAHSRLRCSGSLWTACASLFALCWLALARVVVRLSRFRNTERGVAWQDPLRPASGRGKARRALSVCALCSLQVTDCCLSCLWICLCGVSQGLWLLPDCVVWPESNRLFPNRSSFALMFRFASCNNSAHLNGCRARTGMLSMSSSRCVCLSLSSRVLHSLLAIPCSLTGCISS